MFKKNLYKKIILITASLGLFNFSGCANKPQISKPVPIIQKDKIQSMKDNFDLYVLNTFKNIDSFKGKVDKKILNLTKKPQNFDEFIYYK